MIENVIEGARLTRVIYGERVTGSADRRKESSLALVFKFQTFIQDFRELRKSDKELAVVPAEKTMLASLFTYCQLSGQTLQSIHRAGFLVPGVYVYDALAVELDDTVDTSLAHGHATDFRTGYGQQNNGVSPRDLVDRACLMVSTNLSLTHDQREASVLDIREAVESYIVSEQRLVEMAAEVHRPRSLWNTDPYENLLTVAALRKAGFGQTARVLTRVLNGQYRDGQYAIEVEDKMVNFALATEVMDGRYDVAQDNQSGCMSIAIAANNYDSRRHLPRGTTAKRLEDYFFAEMAEPAITDFVRQVYGVYLLKEKLGRVFRST